MKKILFYSVNGIGLGHIARTSTLANEIKKTNNAEVLVLTRSKYVGFLEEKNIPFIQLKFEQNENLKEDVEKFKKTIDDFSPDLVVFDSFIIPSIVEKLKREKRKIVLIQRFGKKEKILENLKINSTYYKMIDLVIYPTLLELDIELKNFFEDKIVKINPIVRDESHKLEKIKEKYKIKDKEKIVCITFGGGGNIDTDSFLKDLKTIIDIVNTKTLARFMLFESPYKKITNIYAKNVEIYDFEPKLNELFKLSSIVLAQAGYNTFHEILFSKTPVIFFPTRTKTDDQFKRAKLIEKFNAGKISNNNCKDIANMIINFLANNVKNNLNIENGNSIAKKLILEQCETNEL